MFTNSEKKNFRKFRKFSLFIRFSNKIPGQTCHSVHAVLLMRICGRITIHSQISWHCKILWYMKVSANLPSRLPQGQVQKGCNFKIIFQTQFNYTNQTITVIHVTISHTQSDCLLRKYHITEYYWYPKVSLLIDFRHRAGCIGWYKFLRSVD